MPISDEARRKRWADRSPAERSARARQAWDALPEDYKTIHAERSRSRDALKIAQAARRGQPLSEETKARISAAKRGHKATAETRAKLSARWQGRTFSPEHRAHLSEANRQRRTREDPEMWASRTARGLAAMHAANAKRAAGAPTSLERTVAAALDHLGVSYAAQQKISWYHVDFLVGQTVLECNGCYWHACEACGQHALRRRRALDAGRYTRLAKRGYRVAVIWEHEVIGLGVPAVAALLADHLSTSTDT